MVGSLVYHPIKAERINHKPKITRTAKQKPKTSLKTFSVKNLLDLKTVTETIVSHKRSHDQ